MDLRLNPDLETFRREIRAFIDDVLPAEIKERQRRKVANNAAVPDQLEWMRILHRHGRSVPHWPLEFGGCGWTPMQLFIFNEELYAADAPEFDWGGTHMLGPVLYTYGSHYLRDRFLPMIREGQTNWAQGFSEPGSGSDLASLRTSAELVGDKYIVNGQKIWTSGAAHADWGFFLVRTDKTMKPQRGISFLIIKMDTPGVTVRQIPQINGEAHLCEVFLDNVEVPADQLVGEPEMGWTYGKFLLEHERTTSSFIYWSKRELARAKDIARGEVRGRRIADDPAFRARFARIEADLLALEWSVLRVLAQEELEASEAAAASVLKIRGSELQQAISMLQADALGIKSLRYYDVAPTPPPPPTEIWPDYAPGRTSVALILRAATIYGGTKQVQKNILSKLVFGL